MPGFGMTPRKARVPLLTALGLLPMVVAAGIPEYQVVRIIAYNSSCQLDELSSEDLGDAGLRFHATCRNINSYPDGMILDCPQRDDAYACEIVTEERSFDVMDSLRDQVDSGNP